MRFDKEQLTGYSMTNAPAHTRRTGLIELSVKDVGNHPVTEWLYKSANVGDKVHVKGLIKNYGIFYLIGGQGSFYFKEGLSKRVVCIGAGIGGKICEILFCNLL